MKRRLPAGSVSRYGRGAARMPFISATVLCTVIVAASIAESQVTNRPWRETFQVDAPLLAAKRLENVRGLFEQEAWAPGLAALADLEEEFPASLVQIARGRYLNVPLAARLLRTHLPPAGLEVYRQQIDGWAEQQFAAAVDAHDEAALQQLLTSAFASSDGDDALDKLAEWAWEGGDVAAARRLWTRMIAAGPPGSESPLLRFPDTDHDLAAVYARLILCSLAEGDIDRARGELSVFSEMFPQAEGTLAGQNGKLLEILGGLIAEPDDWRVPTGQAAWSTFARNSTRNDAMHGAVFVGRPLWTLSLNPVYVPRWERPRSALPERGLLARFPVTYGDGLFFHNGTTIHGLQMADGKPLWPIDESAAGEQTPGKIYPPFRAVTVSLPWPVVGLPHDTSTIHDGRLFALLGPSVLTLPPEGHVNSPTRLVSLNLAEGEGRLEWFATAEELFPGGWSVTGTPVADQDRLYVPLLTSDPQMEQAVACLRTEDGQVVWQRTIGQALRQPLGGRVELGHQLLTFADERLFLSTDLGAIVCVDVDARDVAWAVTYPSQERDAVDRSDEFITGLLPPVYHEGVVYVKPNDSNEVMAIDADTGSVHWHRLLPGPIVHLLGVANDTLVASGDHLWGIDVETGRLRWRFGYDDAAGYGYGSGAIAGHRVVWPTREDLFVVDLATGQPVQRIPLFDSLGIGGGNVTLTRNRLVIAGRDHLTAFEVSHVAADQ